MGKTSRTLIAIVVIGITIVSYWVYSKYIRDDTTGVSIVTVEHVSLEDIVRARGEVVPEHEYRLEFPFSGTISRLYVAEGDAVEASQALASLDAREYLLEITRLEALRAQRKADLAKIIAGGSADEITVSDTRVASARVALQSAEGSEGLALRAVYTAMDDAVRGTTDVFYQNPRSREPQLTFYTHDSALESSLLTRRSTYEDMLKSWALELTYTPPQTDLAALAQALQADAAKVGFFLDDNARALNAALGGSNVSASTIEGWQSLVAAARVALNSKTAALAASEEARSAAASALALAQEENAKLKRAGREEDVDAAEALVREIESQINIVRDKIERSTLRASAPAEVAALNVRVGETFHPGNAAVVLFTRAPKIESDISELDIVRLSQGPGMPARVSFDAIPNRTFDARVSAIQPQKIDKDGDTYYRVDLVLTEADPIIRPGMSAEVRIIVAQSTETLAVPEYVIFERDGLYYVEKKTDEGSEEVQVTLGISDGSQREIVSGLSEGDQVIVPTE